jgi:hypothetical protein
MRLFFIVVVLALAFADARAAPIDNAPGDVRELIGRARAFNEICRGGDVDADSSVCRQRDRLYRNLETKGWCAKSDTSLLASTDWRPCGRRTAPSRPSAPASKSRAGGSFAYENENPNAALPGALRNIPDPMFRQRNLHQYLGSLWGCLPDTIAGDIAVRGMRDKSKVIDRSVEQCAPAAWRQNYAMLIGTTPDRLELIAREQATRAFTIIPGVREKR